jgi:hypothetical protein
MDWIETYTSLIEDEIHSMKEISGFLKITPLISFFDNYQYLFANV